MIKESRGIQDVSDYNDYATEMFEEFLQDFNVENGLIRKAFEDELDLIEFEGWEWMYTMKGSILAERYLSRLYTVGANHFPEDLDWLEIKTRMYQD